MKFLLLTIIILKNIFVFFLNIKEKLYIQKHSKNIPENFKDVLDESKFSISNSYNIEKLNFFKHFSDLFSNDIVNLYLLTTFKPFFKLF